VIVGQAFFISQFQDVDFLDSVNQFLILSGQFSAVSFSLLLEFISGSLPISELVIKFGQYSLQILDFSEGNFKLFLVGISGKGVLSEFFGESFEVSKDFLVLGEWIRGIVRL